METVHERSDDPCAEVNGNWIQTDGDICIECDPLADVSSSKGWFNIEESFVKLLDKTVSLH